VRRVLHGLVLADWVHADGKGRARTVLALETDPTGTQQLREMLGSATERYVGKVVRDRLGMQLLMKRARPDAVLLALDCGENWLLASEMRRSKEFTGSKMIGILPSGASAPNGSDAPRDPTRLNLDAVLQRPYSAEQLAQTLDQLFAQSQYPAPSL
jgi:hypothetical protein